MGTDENGNRIPWYAYGTIATTILVQVVGSTIWLTQLGSRLGTIEERGSVAAAHDIEALRERIIIIEERQREVVRILRERANRANDSETERSLQALPSNKPALLPQ